MPWKAEFEPDAKEQLYGLTDGQRKAAKAAVDALEGDPYGPETDAVRDFPLRKIGFSGDRRIVYEVDDDAERILILAIGRNPTIWTQLGGL